MPNGDKYRVHEVEDDGAKHHTDQHHDGHDEQQTPGLLLHRSTYRQTASKLRAAYDRHRGTLNVGNLEREQPFSWQNCLFSLFSYALMLSDVFRTGLAIKALPYPSLEPDTYTYFGPFAYVTQHLTTANATTTEASKFWTYKYDTTSFTMRAVAQHLELPQWSPCLLYKERCDESKGIPLATVFTMIDSLVDGVANHEGVHASRLSGTRHHGVLTLRTMNEYKDRVYHYALPWLFQRNVLRTSQAIHGTYNASLPASTSCSGHVAARRPYSCSQSWTNFRRTACKAASNLDPSTCHADAPRLWDFVTKRHAHLAHHYLGLAIDFAILDGMEDYTRGGMTYQGRKNGFEVVVFSRVRDCSHVSNCTTVAVDDYRYEAGTSVINAPDWYSCVAILRTIGQTYAWLRVAMLIAGCCAARMREQRFQDATLVARVLVTARTVFLIPSQVVIYGSSFPISVYLLAHLIDSPAAYELVTAYFTSMLGQINWNLGDLVQQCAISMRTVWVVGFLCHRIVNLTTSSSWSPIHGIPGTAEFSITFIASLTIFAQFRSVSFRQARVLEIFEIPASARRAQYFADTTLSSRTTIMKLIAGTPIDTQCLFCGFLGLLSFTVSVWLIQHTIPKAMPLHLTLASSTIAPYSAGTLWPRNRLVVSWYGNILSFERGDRPATDNTNAPSKVTASGREQGAALESMTQAQRLYRQIMDTPDKSLVLRDNNISKLLQRNMYAVDKRSREIESTVFLVNLAAMTDLFTFLDLRVFDGRLIGLYQSKQTLRCFLLPYGLVACEADIPIDWDELILVAVVNSKDMEWPDLMRCG